MSTSPLFLAICCLGGRQALWVPTERQPVAGTAPQEDGLCGGGSVLDCSLWDRQGARCGDRNPLFPSPGSEALVFGSQSEFFIKAGLCQPVIKRHLKWGEMGLRSTESQPDATPGQHQQLSYQSPGLLSMCAGSGRFHPQSL